MPVYDLTLNGVTHRRVFKRGVMLRIAHAAVQAGITPGELAPTFHHPEASWFSAEGNLTGEELRRHLPEQRWIRYFLEDNELLHVDGRTYALTNQWGDPSWGNTVKEIAARWPQLGIEVRGEDWRPGPAVAAERELPPDISGAVAGAGGAGPDLPEIDQQLLGAAGEYYVLFQLHRRGLLAGLTPRGYRDVDIHVMSPELEVSASVQVKTRRSGHHGGWRMGKKHEVAPLYRLHFCLVDLEPARPVTFVVPAEVVAKAVRESHAAWLAMGNHNDHDMRVISSDWGFAVPGHEVGWLARYEEAWDLLLPDELR
jgi:hypothetical protein